MADAPTKLSDLTGFTELNEFGVTPREEHFTQSLANPQLPGAMKLGALKEITKARLRHQFSNLIDAEFTHMQAALAELRAENPKVYLDQVMELAKFALPQMKAVELEQESESGRSAKNLSMNELMKALMEPADDTQVVSVQ